MAEEDGIAGAQSYAPSGKKRVKIDFINQGRYGQLNMYQKNQLIRYIMFLEEKLNRMYSEAEQALLFVGHRYRWEDRIREHLEEVMKEHGRPIEENTHSGQQGLS